jgi:hypothetical protein
VNDGGYPSRQAGAFNITFAVQAERATTITVRATVGRGAMPTLTVPTYKRVDKGAAFGETQYMQGVSATDPEDGNIAVRHDSPVNTAVEGYYSVSYSATDSDGNTARGSSLVFVGPWTISEGYAINAYNFTKRVGQVRGVNSEMISSARAQAICVDPSKAEYGRAVQVTVQDDGGYSARKAGSFPIKFAVQAAPGVTKTITANVTSGEAPVLTVPTVRRVPEGAGFNYMSRVTATDTEDGNITSKVIHSTPVNTNNVGAYKVTYAVTDSDGNTVTRNGVVLVGNGWVVRGGYAIYAQDFARRLSAISGTRSEAIRLAKAMAVRISSQSSADFGEYVTVVIADGDGYKKAAGTYNIKFAVSASRNVTKTIRASISNDTPRTPPAVPAPNVVINNEPPAAAPVTEPAPTPEPVVVEVPAPAVPEAAPETTETPIESPEIPMSAPESRGAWHLIDLLLVIAAMAVGFFLMAYALRRRDEYDEETSSRGRQIRMWGQLGVMLGILSVIVLIFTQNFTGDMKIADAWSILFAVVCGTEVLALVGVTGLKDREWEEEREV